MKKIFSALVTISLIGGVGIAIYQSANKQAMLTAEQNVSVVNRDESLGNNSKKNNKENREQQDQVATKLILNVPPAPAIQEVQENPKIEPIKGFFEDKISEKARLHIIGIYEGVSKEDDDAPWWSKCPNFHDEWGDVDQQVVLECHQKYAGNHSEKSVTVDVTYSKAPLIIALMAYDSTLWKINIGQDAKVEGVILAGYEQQRLTGLPSDIMVAAYSYHESDCGECIRGDGYFYAYKNGGRDYNKAVSQLKEITGKSPSSFQGSYRSGKFSISNHLD